MDLVHLDRTFTLPGSHSRMLNIQKRIIDAIELLELFWHALILHIKYLYCGHYLKQPFTIHEVSIFYTTHTRKQVI